MTPYPKGHPLATLSIDEQIEETKALTVDDAKRVYTELVGATYGDVAVVGDFDANAVRQWARTTFDSWRSPRPFRRLERQFQDIAQFNESIETPDKANAVFLAGQNLKVRDDSPEWPAIVMGNFVLGGGFLNSRLATRIRQRDDISYGVGSFVSAQQLDSVASITAQAIYAPENILRLESAFGEEMGRILNEGITQAELDAARSAMLQQREQTRSNDGSIAAMLSNQALTGRSMQFETPAPRPHGRAGERGPEEARLAVEDLDRQGGRLQEQAAGAAADAAIGLDDRGARPGGYRVSAASTRATCASSSRRRTSFALRPAPLESLA
jgi:zinc protease